MKLEAEIGDQVLLQLNNEPHFQQYLGTLVRVDEEFVVLRCKTPTGERLIPWPCDEVVFVVRYDDPFFPDT